MIAPNLIFMIRNYKIYATLKKLHLEIVKLIDGVNGRTCRHVAQCFDPPIFEAIHPSMEVWALINLPGALYDGSFGEVIDLFTDI
jgi:hypothetical protein